MLDWTKNPLAAAFFAAKTAFELQDADRKDFPTSQQVIYAFKTINFSFSHIIAVGLFFSEDTFIRAQDGYFTVDQSAEDYYLRTGEYRDLERTLGQHKIVSPGGLKKFTLP